MRSFTLLMIIASSFAIHVRMKAHLDKEMGELESITLLTGLVSVILAAFVQSEGETSGEFNRPLKKWSVPAVPCIFYTSQHAVDTSWMSSTGDSGIFDSECGCFGVVCDVECHASQGLCHQTMARRCS